MLDLGAAAGPNFLFTMNHPGYKCCKFQVDPSGSTVLAGFSSGVVRQFTFNIETSELVLTGVFKVCIASVCVSKQEIEFAFVAAPLQGHYFDCLLAQREALCNQ